MGEEIPMGETITKGAEDGPNKKSWTRVDGMPTDARVEKRVDTVFKNLHGSMTKRQNWMFFWRCYPYLPRNCWKL